MKCGADLRSKFPPPETVDSVQTAVNWNTILEGGKTLKRVKVMKQDQTAPPCYFTRTEMGVG